MTLPSEAAGLKPGAARVERSAVDWIGEPPTSGGLPLYLAVLRARIRLIALMVALGVGAAAIALATTEETYEAEADLLVTPIPRNNTNLFGFGLVFESGDPTRDAGTFAQLITTPAVAERARRRLGLKDSAASLLGRVTAEPVATSGIVTITAKANDPELAASMANAFGRAAIAERTRRLRGLLNSVIPRLRLQLARLPSTEGAGRDALAARLQDLETLRVLDDPTLHFETRAVAPAAPVAPRPLLTIAAAFVASLVVAIGVVLGSQLLHNRITSEEELRRYRIPILARIPRERPGKRLARRGPLMPADLPSGTLDAFHRLGSSLTARSEGGDGHTLFITGAAPSVGKTTTSLNLAASLASMNERVILIEADSRKPVLRYTLGIPPGRGVATVVNGHSSLAVALEQPPGLPRNLRVLCQELEGLDRPPYRSADAPDALVEDAELLADWIIFDGPPLNYAPDALPLAKRADGVVLVIHIGGTRASELAELAELLRQHEIVPAGFVVLGGKSPTSYYQDFEAGRSTARF